MAYPKTVLSNTCHQQPRVLPHHHFHLLLHTRARRFVFTIIGCISSIAWQNCICPTIATLARNNHHHLHHFSTFDASAPCHCCHNFRLPPSTCCCGTHSTLFMCYCQCHHCYISKLRSSTTVLHFFFF